MQDFIDNLIRSWGHDPAAWPWTQFLYLAFMGAAAFIVVNFAAISAGIFSWAERRVAARMQSRVGPHPVRAFRLLPWGARRVEVLLHEDLVASPADAVRFLVPPYLLP